MVCLYKRQSLQSSPPCSCSTWETGFLPRCHGWFHWRAVPSFSCPSTGKEEEAAVMTCPRRRGPVWGTGAARGRSSG